MPIDSIRFLDAVATRASLDLVSRVEAADLARPTPCAAWTLHDLLAHMTAQHLGFAAAAAGDGDLGHWRTVPLGPDPVATYRDSVSKVLTAFGANDIADRRFPLPEFTTEVTFAAEQAIGFHFVDYVVHSWDVARTLDVPVRFEQEVLDAALRIAESVPDDEQRLAPGSPFGPAVDAPAKSTLDKIVALLGRPPSWPDQAEAA